MSNSFLQKLRFSELLKFFSKEFDPSIEHLLQEKLAKEPEIRQRLEDIIYGSKILTSDLSKESKQCPSEEEIAAYFSSTLPDEERQALSQHIQQCAACSYLLLSLKDEEKKLAAQKRPFWQSAKLLYSLGWAAAAVLLVILLFSRPATVSQVQKQVTIYLPSKIQDLTKNQIPDFVVFELAWGNKAKAKVMPTDQAYQISKKANLHMRWNAVIGVDRYVITLRDTSGRVLAQSATEKTEWQLNSIEFEGRTILTISAVNPGGALIDIARASLQIK